MHVRSSGNHGGALALAAKWLGIPCTVIAPEGMPACKQAAIQGYGATLQLCEATMTGREAACAAAQLLTGATFIHPYNSPEVMAGQGTIALEFLEQVRVRLDAPQFGGLPIVRHHITANEFVLADLSVGSPV